MKQSSSLIIIGIILVIAAFFGGKSYGAKHAPATAQSTRSMRGIGAGGYGGFQGGARGNGGVLAGQVISKDATSITVATPGGGSRIILYSPSTSVYKSASGSVSDVTAGASIMVTGTPNPDGSMSATSIQIRPTLPTSATPSASQSSTK